MPGPRSSVHSVGVSPARLPAAAIRPGRGCPPRLPNGEARGARPMLRPAARGDGSRCHRCRGRKGRRRDGVLCPCLFRFYRGVLGRGIVRKQHFHRLLQPEVMRLARAEKQGDHSPQKPPQLVGHLGEPFHALAETGRIGECIAEQAQRAECHHGAGQAVQTVHRPVIDRRALRGGLGRQRGQQRLLQRRAIGFARAAQPVDQPRRNPASDSTRPLWQGRGDHLGRHARRARQPHRLAQRSDGSDHAHALVLSRCSAGVR
jgi:hypothetical protein